MKKTEITNQHGNTHFRAKGNKRKKETKRREIEHEKVGKGAFWGAREKSGKL